MDFEVILKLVFSLSVVVGLLLFLSYILKHYILRFATSGRFEDIKIRDVKFIGKDRGIATFEFDNRVFLISFDNNRIEKLYEREDEV
ncbi:MAG: hypothetical protein N2Z80_00395 [Hydrogenothermaceae bacterium]|nr:hypothetical protein [Hydrogenothermaceae bacterium]